LQVSCPENDMVDMNYRLMSMFAVALLAFSCSQAPDDEPAVHELTQTEKAKARLDDSSTAMWEASGLSSLADIPGYLVRYGKVEKDGNLVTGSLGSPKGEVFSMKAEFVTLEGLVKVEGSMPEGISFSGSISLFALPYVLDPDLDPFSKAKALDEAADITVFDSGEPLCRAGVEPYHFFEAGEDTWILVPVLRFDDGTSYVATTLLMVQPFVELILGSGEEED